MDFVSINPTTGKEIARHAPMSENDIEDVLAKGARAFAEWRMTSFDDRAKVLVGFADALEANKADLAAGITEEMGKPTTQAIGEVEKSAFLCRHLAEHAGAYLSADTLNINGDEVVIRPDPLGLLYSVTPWNFPVWQMVRFAAPAIAAGNPVVVKPAPNVIGVSKLVIEALAKVSPVALYQALIIDHQQSDNVIADKRVAAVGLTGSERAGAAVAAVAGQNLKKVLLELGGSDPFIVLEDADIERAAAIGAKSRFMNTGQVCIAAKRFIIADKVYDKFRDAFAAEAEALKIGDPTESDTFLGPMARADLRDIVVRQTDESISLGAQPIVRGGPQDGDGFFYSPTVLEAAPDNAPVACQEVFGPTAVLYRVKDDNTAIERANNTAYGLSAAIWSGDTARAEALAQRIDAGGVFINGFSQSHPETPIGGVKISGFGRELGRDGVREFTNVKTIWKTAL
ncbi:MAG: aldehyde dehydrogenase family protein [Pseudomonadota bacterium]